MSPPAWHDEALRLKSQGLSSTRIAVLVGRSTVVVHRFLSPEYGRKQREYVNKRTAERKAADPAFRARRAELNRAAAKRSRIRKAARQEAAETGVPVEQVYEKWGVQ